MSNCYCENPFLFMPKIIYAAPGIETNIYFANVWRVIAPQNYAYVVKCPVGRQDIRRWSWTPDQQDAGREFEITIEIYDDNGWVTAQSSVVKTAKVASRQERKITFSLLADSLVNSQYPEALRQLMLENGLVNYLPVGAHLQPTLTPGKNIAHDGLGGFSWQAFLTRWTYSRRELSLVQEAAEIAQMKEFGIEDAKYGEHLLRSPLLRLEKGHPELDIPGWLQKINHGHAPDFMVIELGVNDCFACMRAESGDTFLEQILSDANRLLDEIRIYAPETVIGVALPPWGGTQDGFGESYGCDYSCYVYQKWQLAYNIAVTKMVAKRHDPKLSILALHHNIDPESGYIFKEVLRNSRSTQTLKQCVNGVHPSKEGGLQIADSIYCWLMNHFS